MRETKMLIKQNKNKNLNILREAVIIVLLI